MMIILNNLLNFSDSFPFGDLSLFGYSDSLFYVFLLPLYSDKNNLREKGPILFMLGCSVYHGVKMRVLGAGRS